jgi:hypothetical protein
MTNLETYYSALTDDCGFVFQRTCGSIADPENPKYDRSQLYITMISGEGVDRCAARIQGREYYPSNFTVYAIQDMLTEHFQQLISIALKGRRFMDLKSYDEVVIKINSVHIMIDCCSLCQHGRDFVYSILDQIVDMITGYL